MNFPESELAAIVDAAIALTAVFACCVALYAIAVAVTDTRLSDEQCVETADVTHCYQKAAR